MPRIRLTLNVDEDEMQDVFKDWHLKAEKIEMITDRRYKENQNAQNQNVPKGKPVAVSQGTKK